MPDRFFNVSLHLHKNITGKPIKNDQRMSLFRVILAIIFPPLAVVDKGCGSFLITLLLTGLGWAPGVIGALIILNKEE